MRPEVFGPRKLTKMRLRSKKLLVSILSSALVLWSWASPGFAASPTTVESSTQILLDTQATTAQRIQAAKFLGRSDDPRALQALIRSMERSGESLRDVVIEILQQGKGVEILAKQSVDSSLSIEQRVLAVRGLRVMKNPIGFPALKQLLSASHEQLRAEAAWALSLAGASTAEPELIRALDDPDKDVRYFVADALGSVKTPSAIAALENRKKTETDPAVLYMLKQKTN